MNLSMMNYFNFLSQILPSTFKIAFKFLENKKMNLFLFPFLALFLKDQQCVCITYLIFRLCLMGPLRTKKDPIISWFPIRVEFRILAPEL